MYITEDEKNEMCGIYKNRYRANKEKSYGDVVVKVCAGPDEYGYKIMSAEEYRVFKNQK